MGFFSVFLKTVSCLSLMGYVYGNSFWSTTPEEVTSTTNAYTTNKALRGPTLYESLRQIVKPSVFDFLSNIRACSHGTLEGISVCQNDVVTQEPSFVLQAMDLGSDEWAIYAEYNGKKERVKACRYKKDDSSYRVGIQNTCEDLLYFSKTEGFYIRKPFSREGKATGYLNYERFIDAGDLLVLHTGKKPGIPDVYESREGNEKRGYVDLRDIMGKPYYLLSELVACEIERKTAISVCQVSSHFQKRRRILFKAKEKKDGTYSIYAKYQGKYERVHACEYHKTKKKAYKKYTMNLQKNCRYQLYYSMETGFFIQMGYLVVKRKHVHMSPPDSFDIGDLIILNVKQDYEPFFTY